MSYILKKNYSLRGFLSGEQPIIVDSTNGKHIFVSQPMMSVLKMCDGTTDFDNFTLFPVFKQLAKVGYEKGWLEEAAPGQTLLPEQIYKVIELPHFYEVQWSITGFCNAKCRHCFITACQHTHKDLTTEEMIKILDRLAENEIHAVSITGGEPLLRPDLPLLLDEMEKRKIKVVGISTNGFLLNDKMIDLFLEHGMRPSIQISFDGVGHHDWMRGIKGAEEMAIAAMDSCRRKGIQYTISMCVHKENTDLIVPTVRFAAEHGAFSARIGLVGDIGGFKDNEGMTLLGMNEAGPYYINAIRKIIEEQIDINVEISGFIKFEGKNPKKYEIVPMARYCDDRKKNRACKTVEKTFYISDEGKALPCIMVAGSWIEDNCNKLTEHSLEECINSPIYKEFLRLRVNELVNKNPECLECEYLPYCGCGCRGVSAGYSGNIYGIDKDRCSFFKNHWHEKIREVMEEFIEKQEQQ